MALRDAILPEYDHETSVTRRLLERVPPPPGSRWTPHSRSVSLGELAAHLADIPRWLPRIVRGGGYDMAGTTGGAAARAHETTEALLETFDRNVALGRESIAAADDGDLLAPWTLTSAGHVALSTTRAYALRRYVLNHLVHHRGQLTVYLRQSGLRVPSVCGPSADER